MALLNSSKNLFYALLIAFLASMALSACSSSEEESDSSSGSGSSGDSDMTCDEGDSKEECMNDIL
jgi:hypothetical protein